MPDTPILSNLWDTAGRRGFDYLSTYKSYVSYGAEGFYPTVVESSAIGVKRLQNLNNLRPQTDVSCVFGLENVEFCAATGNFRQLWVLPRRSEDSCIASYPNGPSSTTRQYFKTVYSDHVSSAFEPFFRSDGRFYDEKHIPLGGARRGILGNRDYEEVLILGPQEAELV